MRQKCCKKRVQGTFINLGKVTLLTVERVNPLRFRMIVQHNLDRLTTIVVSSKFDSSSPSILMLSNWRFHAFTYEVIVEWRRIRTSLKGIQSLFPRSWWRSYLYFDHVSLAIQSAPESRFVLHAINAGECRFGRQSILFVLYGDSPSHVCVFPDWRWTEFEMAGLVNKGTIFSDDDVNNDKQNFFLQLVSIKWWT